MGDQLDAVVLGFGGLGGLIAEKFISAGRNVAAVGKQDWVEAIERYGLNLQQLNTQNQVEKAVTLRPSGQFHLFHPGNAAGLKDLSLKPDGLVILASKTPHLKQIIDDYFDLVYDPKSRQNILLIQNGIMPEKKVEDMLIEKYGRLGEDVASHLIGSLTMARVAITDFERPTIESILAKITMGCYDGVHEANKQGAFYQVMSDLSYVGGGRVEGEFSKDAYRRARFEKAMLNGANVISAIFGAKVGEILTNPFLGDLMQEKIYESVAVAATQGVKFTEKEALRAAAQIYGGVVKDHTASMAQDVFLSIKNPQRELTTEIADLDGEFYNIARHEGIPAQFNKFFFDYMTQLSGNFNLLREQDPQKASAYLQAVIERNRTLVGAEAYNAEVIGYSSKAIANALASSFNEVAATYQVQDSMAAPFPAEKRPELYIMHVDDEPDQLASFSEELGLMLEDHSILSRYDIRIRDFESGESALEAYKQSPQDYYFVISDIRMGAVSGVDLVNRMQGVLPIASMYDTGYDGKEYEMGRLDSGALMTSRKEDRDMDTILNAIQVGIHRTEKHRRLKNYA